MLDKLDAVKAKFDDLSVALTNPDIVSDNKRFSTLSKEYRNKYVKYMPHFIKLQIYEELFSLSSCNEICASCIVHVARHPESVLRPRA